MLASALWLLYEPVRAPEGPSSRPESRERQLYTAAVAIGIIGLLHTNWSTVLLRVASLIN